jgi:predicted esterase
MNAKIGKLDPPSNLSIYYRGPPHEKGPLPALFYFALTGEESLSLHPYNQPADLLEDCQVRVYSSTIPGHGPGLDPKKALSFWAEEISQNRNPLDTFFTKCLENLEFLIEQGWIDPEKIGMAGLSRGAFIGTHLAAKDSRIGLILGYAPLLDLKTLHLDESIYFHPIVDSLRMETQIPHLIEKKLCFHIGNRDLKVGTKSCFQFIHQLTEAGYQQKRRPPEVELIIYPSIGYQGHGTPPSIFQQGIEWVKKVWDIS